MTNLDRARQALAEEKADAIRRCLSTPDGQVLQKVLNSFVEGDLLGATHDETLFNLGAREVAMYLRKLARHSEVMENQRRTGR